MFGLYVVSDRPFDFLEWSVDDVAFIADLDGGSHVSVLAEGEDFLGSLEAYRTSTSQHFNKYILPQAPKARELPTRDEIRERLLPILSGYNVLQMPEGWGKSSIVGPAVELGRKLVFVCKTNQQLVEQEASFRERWPKLRIVRYVSKARHLQETLAGLGVPFEPVYHEALSPYGTESVDEPSTRQKLKKAFEDHGIEFDYRAFFDREFKTYRPPKIYGMDVDVIMCTLAAFQGFCQTKHRPWWVGLGLATGYKRVFERDYEPHPLHPTVRPVVPVEQKVRKGDRTADIGYSGITVIIDDPAYTDLDFRRLVEEKDAVDLHHSFAQVPAYQRNWRYVQHWLDQGLGEMTAKAMAAQYTAEAQAHEITKARKWYFEERPLNRCVGFGLRRGYSREESAPGILILTTEHITARLAELTLSKVSQRQKPGFTSFMKADKITSTRYIDDVRDPWTLQRVVNGMLIPLGYRHARKLGWSRVPSEVLKLRNWKVMPVDTSPTKNCHVTLLTTKLVRRKNKALLLLVHAKLCEEFPDEDLTFIGDSLGLDLNLMNNRGRNDLAHKHSLIKLSVPHRDVAVNLWAQFQGADPRMLNTILLADLANQAIGRNQGHRWTGQTCSVLLDPMYAGLLVQSELVRYQATPWSFHAPTNTGLALHGPITELEKRLKYWIMPANISKLAVSVEGFRLGVALPPKQREHYEAWLDAHSGTDPGILKRWEARQ